MTGRQMEQVYPALPDAGDLTVLNVAGLTTQDHAVRDASFEVRSGEIVGFAGLMGSGKSHAARACAGIERLESGSIQLDGQELAGSSIARCLSRRVVYLPPDRKVEGLLLNRPLRESVSLPWLRHLSKWRLFVGPRQERAVVADLMRKMKLSPPNPERTAESYSGGNQQKALLSRALMADCSALILDEPTVGVDVGARVAIYQRITDMAEQGAAVLLVSSDLPEVLHLCHRVYVFSQGRITAHLEGDAIQEEQILQHMMHWDEKESKV
jgi:ribose transport system ATP-binding protein